jgi:hypothetical protein
MAGKKKQPQKILVPITKALREAPVIDGPDDPMNAALEESTYLS